MRKIAALRYWQLLLVLMAISGVLFGADRKEIGNLVIEDIPVRPRTLFTPASTVDISAFEIAPIFPGIRTLRSFRPEGRYRPAR